MDTAAISASAEPLVAQRATGRIGFVSQTGFYPLYDPQNDQVDRIAPVGRARFQRIIPRYRLSSSETNDTGLGPAFYSTPVYQPPSHSPVGAVPARPAATGALASNALSAPAGGYLAPAPLAEGTGTLVDLFA